MCQLRQAAERCTQYCFKDDNMKLTKLEKDILGWFKDYYKDDKISYQIDKIKKIKREYTGHGFFIKLIYDNKIPKIDIKKYKSPINGPIIISPDIDDDGGCLLFHNNGIIELLEIYAYGDKCKKNINEYKLIDMHDFNKK